MIPYSFILFIYLFSEKPHTSAVCKKVKKSKKAKNTIKKITI
jgi:hypothetical protein